MRASALAVAAVAVVGVSWCPVLPVVAAADHTWYVDADAGADGSGTRAHPFGTLAEVERAAGPGDTIRVLPSAAPLDGGIRLQQGQTIVGEGSPVAGLPPGAPAPLLTNTGARLDGDAVRLADGVTVRNLRIAGTTRGGVYGQDVTGARIVGNDVSGHNTSCTEGFLIPQFNAPTNVPGVGIPIVGGLPNGWAGIMVDAEHRTGGTLLVRDNVVHDAGCGDGIDVRVADTASYDVDVVGNDVHHLRQGTGLKSVLAIGLQARDSSRLTATVSGNTESALGNADDPNLLAAGADSEGVFVNGVGPSRMRVLVDHNTSTNVDGLGGFSANGLETVTMGRGSRVSVVVRDSTFSGAPGDVIEEGALGTDAVIDMRLVRVTAERSAGVGNTWLLPFNNGDCVLAGSLGARNSVQLTVRGSVLRDCANNGISLGSNVVNGHGPTTYVGLDVDRSTVTGNRGGNLGIRNFTRLAELRVKVQRTDLAGSPGLGSAFADVSVEDLGSTDRAAIDLGGGALASLGGNCVTATVPSVNVVRYRVSARRTWWGRPGGPGALGTAVVGGHLDTGEPLPSAPRECD